MFTNLHLNQSLAGSGLSRAARLVAFAGAVFFCVASAPANLVITPTFAASINNDANASTIKATINAAIGNYESLFADPITVFITFQEMSGGVGQSSVQNINVPYASYLTQLTADKTTANDNTAVATLPVQANNPVNGTSTVRLSTATIRAVGGITGVNATTSAGNPDATISLNTSVLNLSRAATDQTKFDLMSVAEHEIDEVLGTASALNLADTSSPKAMDLFRYDQNGARTYSTSSSVQSFFSINGGTTDLARFNQNASGDFGDWFSPGGQTPQVQDAFATLGSHPDLGVELTALDVVGFDLVPEPASVILLGGGLAIGLARRRPRKQ
jgi:hypothetical protein